MLTQVSLVIHYLLHYSILMAPKKLEIVLTSIVPREAIEALSLKVKFVLRI